MEERQTLSPMGGRPRSKSSVFKLDWLRVVDKGGGFFWGGGCSFLARLKHFGHNETEQLKILWEGLLEYYKRGNVKPRLTMVDVDNRLSSGVLTPEEGIPPLLLLAWLSAAAAAAAAFAAPGVARIVSPSLCAWCGVRSPGPVCRRFLSTCAKEDLGEFVGRVLSLLKCKADFEIDQHRHAPFGNVWGGGLPHAWALSKYLKTG